MAHDQSVGILSDVCASKKSNQYPTGYVYIYWNTGCDSTPICADADNDSNYGDNTDSAGDDDNRASSLLNLGYPGGYDDVRFYRLADYQGGSICVGNGQWASNLAYWTFTSGINADNRISSHRWVTSC